MKKFIFVIVLALSSFNSFANDSGVVVKEVCVGGYVYVVATFFQKSISITQKFEDGVRAYRPPAC